MDAIEGVLKGKGGGVLGNLGGTRCLGIIFIMIRPGKKEWNSWRKLERERDRGMITRIGTVAEHNTEVLRA